MINVRYEAPEGQLAKSVSSFYRFEYQGDNLSEPERADRAQLRFQLHGGGEYRFTGGHVVETFPITIICPTSAPFHSVASNPLIVFGWGMLPAGWAGLVGKSDKDYCDTAIDAREIFGNSIMHWFEKLANANSFDEQLAIAKSAAAVLHAKTEHAPIEFINKVDNWLLEHVDPDVELLAHATGLSPRQLERMTKRYYGMPPKKLARKYRALRAAQMLAHGDSLDDNEVGMAFYDQSHLIREVKQFTGLTPSQLRAGVSELTQATMEGRHALGSKVGDLTSKS